MVSIHSLHQTLESTYGSNSVEIIDESHLHSGHFTSKNAGVSHARITVTSAIFSGMNPVARHRHVYAVLKDILHHDQLHALAIATKIPS